MTYDSAMMQTTPKTQWTDAELANLLACPVCDALHYLSDVPDGASARCRRCHTVLVAPRKGAMTRIVMLASTAMVLMVAAVFFPFLTIEAQGLIQKSSVIDAITVLSDGLMLPLAFAVAAAIVVLPLTRLGALVYALAPMAIGWRPAAGAIGAFRLAQTLKPWAMAEVFIVGVAVALVKVAGLAHLTIGPAFWAFVGVVLVTMLKDNFMCTTTVWKTLEDRRT